MSALLRHWVTRNHCLQDIEGQVRAYLKGRVLVYADAVVAIDPVAAPILSGNVQELRICDTAFHDTIDLGTKLMDWQADCHTSKDSRWRDR